uniref:Uncharacterized protein n=1 Tax=Panagrellus redivivus TaxID=6233 RepID=A0A7E4V8K8_PANRE
MPYPINTLPYPFKKRLRQLLTPAETLQFQKATGHLENKHYLLPIQKYQQCWRVAITTDKKLTSSWCLDDSDSVGLSMELGPCMYRPKHIHLHNVLETHLSCPIFDYVLFDSADTLTLSDIVITESLLLALAAKKLKLTTFANAVPFPEVFDVDAPRLHAYFDAFPTMTGCFRPCPAYEGWLQDLIEINKPNLKYINIASDDIEKLFSFCYEDMSKLFKRQCSEFRLNLEYKVDDLTTVELHLFSYLFIPDESVEVVEAFNLSIHVYDDIHEDQYLKMQAPDPNDSTARKSEPSFILFLLSAIFTLISCVIILLFMCQICRNHFS